MAKQLERSIRAHTKRREVNRAHQNRRQENWVQRNRKYKRKSKHKGTKKKAEKITLW